MKKTLLAVFVVFIIAFTAVFAFYWAHERSSRAEADQFSADAQNRQMIPVMFEISAPPSTPPDQPLYLSGSEPALGNWDGAGVRLERGDDGKYRGKVEVMSGIEYAFKLTRGTWGTVEKGANGEELPNRPLRCENPDTIAVQVASWVDNGQTVPGRITVSGVVELHKKFHSSALNNERTLVVYLPAEYQDKPNERYPVLYMHDGQNLFDESASYAGIEWKMDEAAQRLIAEGAVRPMIIVGIYNTPDRTAEFTPPPAGRADVYGKFIVSEVKPFIDKTYRTLSDRAHTSLGGSSMGGLATLAVAKNHPETFGQLAVLTPFLRSGDKSLLEMWNNDLGWMKGMRVWIDMGPSPKKYYPGEDALGDTRAFVAAMERVGLRRGTDFQYLELDEGEHTESSWQTRSDDVLLFLFGAAGTPTTQPDRSAASAAQR